MNDDNGKKLLIGGGLVALGAIILNSIYTSGFQAGLVAGGGDAAMIGRHFGGGFPFGLFFFIGIIGLIWWKVSNGGRRGPGRFFQGRHGLFDDRQQPWQHSYRPQHQPQPGQAPYGAYQPQQPEANPYYQQQAPGAAPQQPVNHGNQSVPTQPPVNYSPPSQPAPGYPQSEPGQTAPPAADDPNKPAS